MGRAIGAAECMWQVCILSIEFFCEPKSALVSKVYSKKKEGKSDACSRKLKAHTHMTGGKDTIQSTTASYCVMDPQLEMEIQGEQGLALAPWSV